MKWLTISDSYVDEDLADFISFNESKTVRLSKGFIQKNKLDAENMKRVVFLYDHTTRNLALDFTTQNPKDSFKIGYDIRQNKGGAKISCHRMYKAFRIDVTKYAGKYSYKVSQDPKRGKIYIIDLVKGKISDGK